MADRDFACTRRKLVKRGILEGECEDTRDICEGYDVAHGVGVVVEGGGGTGGVGADKETADTTSCFESAGKIGAVGVSFEEGTRAVDDGEDEPILVDVAVGEGGAARGVFNLFAAAPEGVVVVFLD